MAKRAPALLPLIERACEWVSWAVDKTAHLAIDDEREAARLLGDLTEVRQVLRGAPRDEAPELLDEQLWIATLGCPTGDCPHATQRECEASTFAELHRRYWGRALKRRPAKRRWRATRKEAICACSDAGPCLLHCGGGAVG